MARKMPDELKPHEYGAKHCLFCHFSENICGRCFTIFKANHFKEETE